MVFSSLPFLFAFLPVVLAGYHLLPRRARNAWLLLASVVFYAWGSGVLVGLLLLSSVVNHQLGRLVASGRAAGSARRVRWAVAGTVVMNLGMLGYFKYANFLIEQLNVLAAKAGWGAIAWDSVALPIGISFFTFQSMSYVLDLVRGRTEPLKRVSDFALYVALFPQLIAGPIVRFHEVSEQIRSRTETIERFAHGAVRFALGLTKKVVIADSVAVFADAAFGGDPGRLTTGEAWIGIIAYTVQIYFDFSGYSDMAIGLGSMFGFRFPENFARPYSALSITDFWRRWHITLSNWFRDYLYVPLGGSRRSAGRTYANLWIVFALTGLWHGANWTFVIWGLYHGALLTAERAFGLRAFAESNAVRAALRRGVVLLAVMVGWVFFRAPDAGHALAYLGVMAGGGAAAGSAFLAVVSHRAVLALAIGVASFVLPGSFVTGPALDAGRAKWVTVGRFALVGAGLLYSTVLLAGGTFSPFLYFQF